jgi:hypothetical protein
MEKIHRVEFPTFCFSVQVDFLPFLQCPLSSLRGQYPALGASLPRRLQGLGFIFEWHKFMTKFVFCFCRSDINIRRQVALENLASRAMGLGLSRSGSPLVVSIRGYI